MGWIVAKKKRLLDELESDIKLNLDNFEQSRWKKNQAKIVFFRNQPAAWLVSNQPPSIRQALPIYLSYRIK